VLVAGIPLRPLLVLDLADRLHAAELDSTADALTEALDSGRLDAPLSLDERRELLSVLVDALDELCPLRGALHPQLCAGPASRQSDNS